MSSGGGKASEGASSGYFSSFFGGAPAPAKVSADAAGKAASATSNPEDIPKEDLLHLCMKMNKRMQALESKGTEVNKRNKELLEEKKQLLDIIKTYLSVPLMLGDSEALDMTALKDKVALYSVQNKDAMKALEDRLAASEREHSKELSALELRMRKELSLQASKHAASGGGAAVMEQESAGSTSQAAVSSQDDYFTAEIDRLMAENEAMAALKDDLQAKLQSYDSGTKDQVDRIKILEQEIMQYEISAREKAEKQEQFAKESEHSKTKAEERILYLQMQLNALKTKEDAKDKEIVSLKLVNDQKEATLASLQNLVKDGEINSNDYREVIKDLHSKITYLEEELDRVKGKGHELEKNSAYTTVLKAEQEAIVSNLRRDLKQANLSREENARRCRELEEYRVKAEAKLGQLSEMIQVVDEARDALEEKEARITSLQSQATVAERNHALRTAMLATAESHIATLKSDLEGKDTALKEANSRVVALQKELSEADGKRNAVVGALEEEADRLKTTLEDERLGHTLELSTLKNKHAEELDHIKKDHTKKSTAARDLISKKDVELQSLTSQVAELKDEIASGAHNERRIFELAKSQSQREATHNLHSDTRELAFQQLQHTLASRDLELAKLQAVQAQLLQENTDLRRVSRREGVNMDYLKNIVVQYMSLPASSTERNALVPVIATLLQLSNAELSAVQTALKAPLWASLPVKSVKPMKPGVGNSSHGKATASTGGGSAHHVLKGTAVTGSNRESNSKTPPPPGGQAVAAGFVRPSSGGSTYSPPPVPIVVSQGVNLETNSISNNVQHHPMLDRSDTSYDQMDIDLGAEDTPEIEM